MAPPSPPARGEGVAPGADFSFASGDFNTLGAPFSATVCNSKAAFKLPHLSVSPIGQPPRVPDLVGSRLPSPYHFRARIQSFQAVAAPFPGGSVLPSASRAAIPPTETPRFKNQRSGSAASDEGSNASTDHVQVTPAPFASGTCYSPNAPDLFKQLTRPSRSSGGTGLQIPWHGFRFSGSKIRYFSA